jgi:hypothetical protein
MKRHVTFLSGELQMSNIKTTNTNNHNKPTAMSGLSISTNITAGQGCPPFCKLEIPLTLVPDDSKKPAK